MTSLIRLCGQRKRRPARNGTAPSRSSKAGTSVSLRWHDPDQVHGVDGGFGHPLSPAPRTPPTECLSRLERKAPSRKERNGAISPDESTSVSLRWYDPDQVHGVDGGFGHPLSPAPRTPPTDIFVVFVVIIISEDVTDVKTWRRGSCSPLGYEESSASLRRRSYLPPPCVVVLNW